MATQNDHVFTVDLTGLNLSEEQLHNINQSIQKAVSAEVASYGSKLTKAGGLLARFDPQIRGIWYFKDIAALTKAGLNR